VAFRLASGRRTIEPTRQPLKPFFLTKKDGSGKVIA
jgi:hypothetical protein